MSGVGPSASTFRSTSSWPKTSLPKPSSSPRTSQRASGSRQAREGAGRANARASSPACHRWNSARLSDGRCNTGCKAPSIAQVRSIALRLAEVLGAQPARVKEVNFDWIEPARKVRISIDQDQARLLGLSSQTLAEALNAVMTGTPITQVRDDIYLVDVIARAQDEQRISLSTLRALQLPLPNGRTVPLSQVASFDFDQEYPLIWRRQRVPTLTVQADVASGFDARKRGPRAGAGNREVERKPAKRTIASKSAVRSRKAHNRRPRSSPRFP